MKKLIDHYKKWVEKGELNEAGLCNSIPAEYLKDLRLFTPTDCDFKILRDNGMSTLYWAHGVGIYGPAIKKRFALTPLRETIILLICAMHDEI